MTLPKHECAIYSKKWIIHILSFLLNNPNAFYGQIQKSLGVPKATLTLRLNELVAFNHIKKIITDTDNPFSITKYSVNNDVYKDNVSKRMINMLELN